MKNFISELVESLADASKSGSESFTGNTIGPMNDKRQVVSTHSFQLIRNQYQFGKKE
jgi:hypothetical protein